MNKSDLFTPPTSFILPNGFQLLHLYYYPLTVCSIELNRHYSGLHCEQIKVSSEMFYRPNGYQNVEIEFSNLSPLLFFLIITVHLLRRLFRTNSVPAPVWLFFLSDSQNRTAPPPRRSERIFSIPKMFAPLEEISLLCTDLSSSFFSFFFHVTTTDSGQIVFGRDCRGCESSLHRLLSHPGPCIWSRSLWIVVYIVICLVINEINRFLIVRPHIGCFDCTVLMFVLLCPHFYHRIKQTAYRIPPTPFRSSGRDRSNHIIRVGDMHFKDW